MPNLDSLKNIINYKTLTTFSLVLLIVMVFTNLISTNILSTQGLSVNLYEQETLALEKENQSLAIRIEEESRLTALESEALSLGFQRVSNIVYAPTENTFALR